MKLDGYIHVSKTFYYVGEYSDFIEGVANNDACIQSPLHPIDEVFHFSRVSPRMNCYHFYVDGQERREVQNAIDEARDATLTIFKLDSFRIAKQALFAIVGKILLESRPQNEGDKSISGILRRIVSDIDKIKKATKGNELAAAITREKVRGKKRKNPIPDISKQAESVGVIVEELRKEFGNSDKETGICGDEALATKLQTFGNKLERIHKTIAKCVDALRPGANLFDDEAGQKLVDLLDKDSAPLKTRSNQSLLAAWLIRSLRGSNEKQTTSSACFFDYACRLDNVTLTVGKDCVCNLILPIRMSTKDSWDARVPSPKSGIPDIEDIAEKPSLSRTFSMSKALGKLTSTFTGLLDEINIEGLVPNERIQVITKSDTSIIRTNSFLPNPNKRFSLDCSYSYFLRFSKMDPDEWFLSQLFPRLVAFQHSKSVTRITELTIKCLWSETRAAGFETNPMRSMSQNDGYDLFFDQRRVVLSCREYEKDDLKRDNKTSHFYRYQAYKDYCQVLTSCTYSSLALAANYLCGLIAVRLSGFSNRSFLSIIRYRVFAVISARINAEYGEETMFKRHGGVAIYHGVFDHYRVQENEIEFMNSITGTWQSANIALSDRYGKLQVFIGSCSCVLALLSIGNVATIACAKRFESICDFFAEVFKSPSFLGSLICFAIAMLCFILLSLFETLYQKNMKPSSFLKKAFVDSTKRNKYKSR